MNSDHMQKLLKTAVTASRRAGDIIMKNLGNLSAVDIQSKQTFDFVTKVDRLSESVIMETVKEAFPSHSFLAEETVHQDNFEDYRWIIDPLDGTTNYIHGFPVFAVSIALEYKKEILLGVVLDPIHDELFYAVKGSGSFLNGNRIHVSHITAPRESLVATGFPFRKKETIDLYLDAFKRIFETVSDLRRAGSAALDFAYLAAGRCDGFFELGLSPWDIAAGSLLVEEAGGLVSDFYGGQEYLSTGNVIAGNKNIHREILTMIQEVFKGKK